MSDQKSDPIDPDLPLHTGWAGAQQQDGPPDPPDEESVSYYEKMARDDERATWWCPKCETGIELGEIGFTFAIDSPALCYDCGAEVEAV